MRISWRSSAQKPPCLELVTTRLRIVRRQRPGGRVSGTPPAPLTRPGRSTGCRPGPDGPAGARCAPPVPRCPGAPPPPSQPGGGAGASPRRPPLARAVVTANMTQRRCETQIMSCLCHFATTSSEITRRTGAVHASIGGMARTVTPMASRIPSGHMQTCRPYREQTHISGPNHRGCRAGQRAALFPNGPAGLATGQPGSRSVTMDP
jgi:hypothetical protein